MPSDLLGAADPGILVESGSGDVLPYSRGIMVTSLLATGVTTEEAYGLALRVQRRLHSSGVHRLGAEELVALATDTIASEPGGSDIARRWTAWRAAKRTGRPVAIVLVGAPGVGKSTFATRLAVRLGITRVVTTDALREVLRTVVPAVIAPELHRSTFELVDTGGVQPFAGYDRQCGAVSAATAAVLRRLATERRAVIAEGAQLTPGAMTAALVAHAAEPLVVERLVTVGDGRHAANLRRRSTAEPLREGHRHVDRFEVIRALDAHLRATAAAAGVETIDAGQAAALTQSIVDEIVSRAAATAAT